MAELSAPPLAFSRPEKGTVILRNWRQTNTFSFHGGPVPVGSGLLTIDADVLSICIQIFSAMLQSMTSPPAQKKEEEEKNQRRLGTFDGLFVLVIKSSQFSGTRRLAAAVKKSDRVKRLSQR
ncbi:hypothetical protein BaRGS_00020035 [Batillaria attramentaria]|uniref:Uncharacterized protein n=1 Tax=Batillaria attramentaria TaxID=370345 RepID=A0ABD0KNC8_9CAEN